MLLSQYLDINSTVLGSYGNFSFRIDVKYSLVSLFNSKKIICLLNFEFSEDLSFFHIE